MNTVQSAELSVLSVRLHAAIHREPKMLIAYYANTLDVTRTLAYQAVEFLIAQNAVQRSRITERLFALIDPPEESITTTSTKALIQLPSDEINLDQYGGKSARMRQVLARGGKWNLPQLEKATGISRDLLRSLLQADYQRGLVYKYKDARNDYYCSWSIEPDSAESKTKVDKLRTVLRVKGTCTAKDLEDATGIHRNLIHALLAWDIRGGHIKAEKIRGPGRGYGFSIYSIKEECSNV